MTVCLLFLPSGTAGPDLKQPPKNVVVGRVAGRAGAMRAIAPAMSTNVCPREGRRRPTPRIYATGEVIYFALVAVYGKIKRVMSARGPR